MRNYSDLIDKLNLIPHPEGGYYRRNWQSLLSADIKDSSARTLFTGRTIGSSILYLLPSIEVSTWHRTSCDEMWHHYSGSPLVLYSLNAQKSLSQQILGSDIDAGQLPQIIMHRGNWFAAETVEPDSYTLCGCTLWPAFTYSDFELADIAKLIDEYPQYKAEIEHIAKRSK